MVLTQQALGKRLQEARNNVGLSQREVAEELKLSRETIAQIEAGTRNITSLEIVHLARLYGRTLGSLLQEEEGGEETPLHALFRMQPGFEADCNLRRQLIHYLEVFREAVIIERLIGEPPRQLPPDYQPREPNSNAEAFAQGQELARQERMRINIGVGPLLDVAAIIAEQGVWAVSAALSKDVSGIFLSHSSIGAAIVVNSNHSRGRRRFSYAHEYAHLLADRRQRSASVSSASNAKELIERRANSFASEFLLPAQAINEFLERIDKGSPSREYRWLYDVSTESGEQVEKRHAPGSQDIGYQDIAFIAHEFMVSYDAVAFRLSDLGRIGRERLNELLSQKEEGKALIDLLKLRDFEGGEGTEDQPYLGAYIGRLALEAYRREAISGGRLREACDLAGLDGDAILAVAKERFDD